MRPVLRSLVLVDLVLLVAFAFWPAPWKYPLGLPALATGVALACWNRHRSRDDVSVALLLGGALLVAAGWTLKGNGWVDSPEALLLVLLAAGMPLILAVFSAMIASGRADPYDD